MSTDADKVRAAADYIGDGHWSQESFSNTPSGEPVDGADCCVHGALWLKAGYDDGYELARGLLRHLGFTGGLASLWSWNDSPERTAEEVVTALREFADTLDAQPV